MTKDRNEEGKKAPRINAVSNSDDTTNKQTVHMKNEITWDDARLLNEHEIYKLIGKGSFGQVYLALNKKNKKKCVIKKIQINNETSEQEGLSEATIHCELNHINIALCDAYWFGTEHNAALNIKKLLYIRMEYCPNGTLAEAIKNGIHSRQRWILGKQLLGSLNYLHLREIIHGDIKSDNIMLDYKNRIKLIDLGNAEKIKSESTGEKELMIFKGFNARMAKLDIQDAGKVLFEICYGPYETEEDLDDAIEDLRKESISSVSITSIPKERELISLLIKGELNKFPKLPFETSDSEDSASSTSILEDSESEYSEFEDAESEVSELEDLVADECTPLAEELQEGVELAAEPSRERINANKKEKQEANNGYSSHAKEENPVFTFSLFIWFVMIVISLILFIFVHTLFRPVIRIIERTLEYKAAYWEILKMAARIT